MPPSDQDVQAMVVALFTLNAGIERARHEKRLASALSLLQVVAEGEPSRPSDIAARQHVHQSVVTRQIRDLEAAGFVSVSGNPSDGRSCLVALTPAGRNELARLTQLGLDRFALFVADWKPEEVRAFTALLEKLRGSMAATADRDEPPNAGRRWARSSERTDMAGG